MKKISVYFLLFIIGLGLLIAKLNRYTSEQLVADELGTVQDFGLVEDTVEEPDTQLAEMTLEQKVGQMFMLGFWGTEPSEYILSTIRQSRVGGIILLKYNIASEEQLRNLIAVLQSEARSSGAGLPLFVSVDQEGGAVVRVRTEHVEEFTAQPAIRDADTAFKVGQRRGEELVTLGFNLNNSPVLDCVRDSSSFIYDRVFQTDCPTSGELGAAMISGYHEAGLLSAVKHFPGHCDGCSDSHDAIPQCDMKIDEFYDQIRSFEGALESEPAMIMTGHVRYPVIDSRYPASLSEPMIGQVLRDFLGYEGVVITDDMEMQALVDNYSIGEAAVQAVKAGNDMLMYASTPERQSEAYDAVVDAIRAGEIPIEQIDASVGRIFKAKQLL